MSEGVILKLRIEDETADSLIGIPDRPLIIEGNYTLVVAKSGWIGFKITKHQTPLRHTADL